MATTLLLADDSVTIQRVIALTFANEDVQVIAESDGDAALLRLARERADIVLVDVALPGVDGYDVSARVKAADPRVPVLILTGAFDPIDETRARASGCDGVLVKPLDPRRLVSTVRALLAGERPAHLWPADMPRIDGVAPPPPPPPPAATAPRPASPPAPPAISSIDEPGPLPHPTAVEAVFESGLDDLDRAFSRLDPQAPPPSTVDNHRYDEFQRDIEAVRNAAPPTPPAASTGISSPMTHLPVEDLLAVEADDLQWDLPSPGTVVEAIPLPASFPEYAAQPQPEPQPEPEPAPLREPESLPEPPPLPPPPPPPPSKPQQPEPPPSLASAFSALLAAEEHEGGRAPARRGTSLSEADVEEVVRRVVHRVTDEVVRRVMHETTERLIREEMERLSR
ncbi:MAG: hypothetical protein AMXMBFR57_11700 [Acidimicrobiia bacterium]